MVEESVADALDRLELLQYIAAHQIAGKAVGVQGVEVVLEAGHGAAAGVPVGRRTLRDLPACHILPNGNS